MGADWKPLKKGDPCLVDESGNVIKWHGETICPSFICEEAYKTKEEDFEAFTANFLEMHRW